MPLITETYYLSLTQDNRGILRLRCSQNDTLRTANLKLYNNGSTFTIPSGISAYVSGVKQNGAVFSKSCTISQDRKSVVLQLSSDITNVDGIIVAEIVLNDGNGDRLGTSNFIIQVEKNPILAGVIQDTETPIEYVNDFITQIQALTARVNNLITPNGDPSLAEVVDARISSLDNNTYQNLKARIDADIAALNTRKANKSEVYTKAQVDTLLDNVEIDVDDELSDESENPVQNKVINREISEIKADLDTLANVTPIPDNSDLNDYVETGLYSVEYGSYTILNYPPVATAASYLEVRRLTTGYVGQKLTIPGNGKVFTRRKFNNGKWNNWIQITGLEPDLPDAVKEALIACFANVEWAGSSPNGDSYINALKNALGMTVSKTFTYPNGGLGSIEGRIQAVSSSDRTATINTGALQAVTVGARSVNADTANLAFNGIYGIKQGSFTKIKYYATTTATNSGAHINIAYVVCKIIDGVYTIASMVRSETANVPDGIQVDLPENPDNDNYILLKVDGEYANARTELAALKMVLIEAPNGGSQTPSTPTPTQEIVLVPNMNIYANESSTPVLAIQSQSYRQSFGAISDEPKIISIPDLSASSYSLIRVPSNKTTVTVTCVTSARCNLAWFDLTGTYQGEPYYHFVDQTGWQAAANTFTFDITGKKYIAINFESSDSNSSNYTLTMS